MKLVMTLLCRDEGDIVDSQLAFHLNAGVDFVIATDHHSQDGTTEILERYAREGHLHLLREEATEFSQAAWVTRMARLAATDFGADWVINADADEFWWPRGGSPKEILSAVPRHYGVVRGFQRHFAPRPEGVEHFAERMTVRITPFRTPPGAGDPFQGTIQVAHRADASATVSPGNHDVRGRGLLPLRGWYPFEVLHFPLRALEQARAKFADKLRGVRVDRDAAGHHSLRAGRAIEEGLFGDWYSQYVVDDATLGRGLTDGTLAVDTRLRDALRRLAGVRELLARPASAYALPGGDARRLELLRGDLLEEAAYAHEMEPLDEWDSQLRAIQRVSALEGRLADLERGLGARVRTRLRRPRTDASMR
ncbi:MAG: hypothetical protein A2Y55_11490 [Actinobacteria bacterium RBG_16_68_12]|nr:MAG: hypothetical protein A2Y55_11490 [Actinobacteria bacterium RBG_16_68_12]